MATLEDQCEDMEGRMRLSNTPINGTAAEGLGDEGGPLALNAGLPGDWGKPRYTTMESPR